MTSNFGGCDERRAMAAQPSAQSEERILLRRLAWEQRNQEISQAKESNHEILPLFGEPYKTTKEDELSNRIQRMLGRYEDVNSPVPNAMEPLPIPSCEIPYQSDRRETSTDHQAKSPPLSEVQRSASQSQKSPSARSHTPQASQTSSPVSSDLHQNKSSSSSKPGQQQKLKVEVQTYLREHGNFFQGMSSQSPHVDAVAEALPPCLHSVKQEVSESHTADRHKPEGPKHYPGTIDVPTFNSKQSPKDLPVTSANKGNVLPAQTFSSLLSKQPTVVMTQKPTAYVRPMDGQDQVVSESPQLKPSPEPYAPLPELINKTEPGKEKMPSQYLETITNDAMCVADILREMTCSWPPVLTAINSPCKAEPSKSPLPTNEVEHISSNPEQKEFLTSPVGSSQHIHDSSSSLVEVVHSRVGESPSSSDSSSSSRSESDTESITEEQSQNSANVSEKTEPDAPGAIQDDWQLWNWIKPSQHNSVTQGPRSSHSSQSLAHKQPGPHQDSTHASLEVAGATKGRKGPQKCNKTSQDCHKQQSHQTAASADPNSCSKKCLGVAASSKASEADCADAAAVVKHGEVKKETHVLDRHKEKIKMHHHKKNKEKGDDKTKSSKHKSHAKEKSSAEPKGPSDLPGRCSWCGVQYPNPCSCPAQPGHLPLSSPAKVRCSEPKSASARQKTSKSPHRTAQKQCSKTGRDALGSRDAHGPPRPLMVTIDLSLLSRVPQISGSHHQHHQEEPTGKGKTSKARLQVPGGAGSKASATQPPKKTSRKTKTSQVEVDSNIPRKKPRLENSCASPSRSSAKREVFAEEPELKKAKKNHLPKDSKSQKHTSGEVGESSKEVHKRKDSCKKKKKRRSSSSSGKLAEQLQTGKEIPKSSSSSLKTKESTASRHLLKSEDSGPHPMAHYIKEAKKLKHKADAEKDKSRKAFSYLEAAMYFVESGIAMEKDPQISRSSYTMFADTVELLRFVLTNVVDTFPPPSEKDFLKVLCLKCQSLLHMAMFHQKHKTALKFSKTLTSHFNNSAQKTHNPTVLTPRVSDTPSPLSSMPSPAITSSSCSGSGLPLDPSSSTSSTVSLPLAIQQTALSYVNITTLFLNAHDMWEQAEEVALRPGGMLRELDAAVGSLSLSSSMMSMVRYTRQAVNWLRLHSQKGK